MTWYSVPGFTTIEVNQAGQVRSTKTKRLRKPNAKSGSPGQRTRYNLTLREPGKPSRKRYISRLVLSAKIGRQLQPWEEARHLNGDHADNRMENLAVGCRLNNVIDDLESGRLQTSVEQIDAAIERLQALKATM